MSSPSSSSLTSTDKVIDDLYAWSKTHLHESMHNNVYLKLIKSSRPEEGRCVIAIGDIDFDRTLVEIPSSLIVNYRTLFDVYPQLVTFFRWSRTQLNSASLVRFNRLDALYVFLIAQRLELDTSSSSSSSSFHAFVASMPTSYDAPEYFATELIACLPIGLRKPIENRVQALRDRYDTTMALLNEFHRETKSSIEYKTIESLVKQMNYELYKWAFCSVNSRCFHIDESELCSKKEIDLAAELFGQLDNEKKDRRNHRHHGSRRHRRSGEEVKLNLIDYEKLKSTMYENTNQRCCLIPFLDFLNHSFEPNAYGYFDYEKRSYVLSSNSPNESNIRPIAAGDQLYIQYGLHDNKTLLIEYGFLLADNVYDRIEFTFDDLASYLTTKTTTMTDDDNNTSSSSSELAEYLIREDYISDMTCNKIAGPSWFLLKAFDLVGLLNNHTNSGGTQRKRVISAKQDIGARQATPIRLIFVDLLHKYQTKLNESLKRLDDYAMAHRDDAHFNSYHVNMSKTFCFCQLEIIDFNLELANNSSRWLEFF